MQNNSKLKACLEETKKMWKWLAANPSMEKDDYLLKHNSPKILYNCHCCEYLFKDSPIRDSFPRIACVNMVMHTEATQVCPLQKLWPNGCEADDSPYQIWMDSNYLEDREEQARRIVAGCDAALAELAEQENVLTEVDR